MPWARLVEGIKRGDEHSVNELYSAVTECARARLYRSIEPQAVDDHVQEVLMVVLAAIRNGELRDPKCLMGFVKTVARRQVAVYVRGAMVRRRRMVSMELVAPVSASRESPEARLLMRQRAAAVTRVLKTLCERDRDILTRFYYEEQDSERICREMRLTATQFRLYKSRALARCCELAERARPARFERVQSTRPWRIA